MPLLQQGDPSSELCASDICTKGFTVRNRCFGRACLWQARSGMEKDVDQEHMANLGKGLKIQRDELDEGARERKVRLS